MQEQAQPRVYRFGHFLLDVTERTLLNEDQTVVLAPKTFDTLVYLVENRGRLVEKQELMSEVWRDAFVEESNLKRNIYLLRRALGDDDGSRFIETVPKHGYRFSAEVSDAANDSFLIVEKHTEAEIITEGVSDSPNIETGAAVPAANAAKSWSLFSLMNGRRALAWLIPIIAIGVILFLLTTGSFERAGGEAVQSIAVLPLKTFSQSADDQALRFGFADALITSLGRVHEIRVISAIGSNRFADSGKEPLEVARDLKVDCVLDGTMQRANGKLRVTLRLLRTSDGGQMWSGTFDEAENEVFKLEDAMAAQTAQSLKRNLTADQRSQLTRRYTESAEAYEAYLRGRFFFERRNTENFEKAIAEFQRAIQLDPTYALAYSGLADALALQANNRNGAQRQALYEQTRATLNKALELDDTLADAHTSLGWMKRIYDWDWRGSELEFKHAIELDPNSVNAHQWYSFLLMTLGRSDESLAEMQKARELDPLSKSVLINFLAVRTFRKEFDQTPQIVQQIIAMDDDKSNSLRILSIDYLMRGEWRKVIEVGNEIPSSNGRKQLSNYRTANLAVAYARIGEQTKSKELLNYLEEQARNETETGYRLAMAYSDLGRKDEAIALLRECFRVHEDRLVWLKVEPRFDPLRDDPRFQELLRKMNL